MGLESKNESIARLLATAPRGAKGRLWGMIGAVVVVIAAAVWFFSGNTEGETTYRTAEAYKGDLVATVSATGTLQPVNKVDVGSELSGTVASVEVDYNDRVTRGQVLARLDTELLTAKQVEARASLQSAKAKGQEAAATVTETRLALRRCEELAPRQMCSQSDLDKLRAAFERAQAAEVMAQAQAAQAQAMLTAQETNLRKAVIRAPIDGVVLGRSVEKGQTVAASFQTPVLFTLADDLARMELLVAVDEADIGQVRVGQSATFTVDAYPGRSFAAEVKQIRQAPKTVEGVVTYETVLSVDNGELLLMPGMTATADIVSTRLTDVLLIPNAALRFSPPAEESTKKKNSGGLFPGMGPPRVPKAAPRVKDPGGMQTVYALRNGAPAPVQVKAGVSDGRNTQVLAGELTPGTALIVDAVSKTK